jgi:hypothetical protein
MAVTEVPVDAAVPAVWASADATIYAASALVERSPTCSPSSQGQEKRTAIVHWAGTGMRMSRPLAVEDA